MKLVWAAALTALMLLAVDLVHCGETANLFDFPAPISAEIAQPVDLFSLPPAVSESAPAIDLFALEVQVSTPAPRQIDLFAMNEADLPLEESPRSKPAEAAKPDTRPVIVVWSPSWCSACRSMESLVGNGDAKVRVRWIKGDPNDGDEARFLPEVLAFAKSAHPQGPRAGQERGWPVLQYQPIDGKGSWQFCSGARSIEDLHALTRLRCKDPVPSGHFREAQRMTSNP